MEAKSLNLCMNKYVVHCVLINKMELFFFLFHNSGSLLLNTDFFCSKFKKCQSVLSKEMYILLIFFKFEGL